MSKRDEQGLPADLSRLASALDQVADSVFITDKNGVIVHVNRTFEQLTGYAAGDAIGKTPKILKSGEHGAEFFRAFWQRILSGEAVREVFINRRRNGELYPEAKTISPIRDPDGSITHFLSIGRDVTARERAARKLEERGTALARLTEELKSEIETKERFEAQLVRAASHDGLTGLLNRRSFEERLGQILTLDQARPQKGALILVGLDNFGDVNNSLGYGAGDHLLQRVTELLLDCLRGSDVAARVGGDQFAILLLGIDGISARKIAERIWTSLRGESFDLQGIPLYPNSSIAIVDLPNRRVSVSELMDDAASTLQLAKNSGRGRIVKFTPRGDRQNTSTARLAWHHLIRDALVRDAFVLYAQPIRDLQGTGNSHFEVLIRLPLANGDVAVPAQFLQIADDYGLSLDIDRWVIKKAIEAIATQERARSPVNLAVNLSARALADPDMLDLIKESIDSARIDPKSLTLEVTESAAIADLREAQNFIRTVKNLGCGFSLDDFGAGFSSFAHLKHLQVDYLKIDGLFIEGLRQDKADQEIVQAISSLAQALSIKTIGEFVGDKETLRLLTTYHVDYAQGYYLGRPRELSCVLGEIYSASAA